jgi:hypothetical protein
MNSPVLLALLLACPGARAEDKPAEQLPSRFALSRIPDRERRDAPGGEPYAHVLLAAQHPGRPLPVDLSPLIPRLGSEDYRTREAAHRQAELQISAALSSSPLLARETLVGILAQIDPTLKSTEDAEIRQRLRRLRAGAVNHAEAYICRCVARCRNGVLETSPFEARLLRDRCGVGRERYMELLDECSRAGRFWDPHDEDGAPLEMACRVAGSNGG